MMWALTPAAEAVLRSSHSIRARGTVYSPALGVYPNLPLSDGSVVNVDCNSQVRRTGELVVADPDLWPAHPQSLLSPMGSEIQLDYGIVLEQGDDEVVEWIPVGRLRITKADREKPVASSGPVQLGLEDRAARVAEARFLYPTQTRSNVTAVAEIARLVTEVLPSVEVIDLTGNTSIAARIEVERERWETIEKLADSIGAETYFDSIGRLIVRPQPTLDSPPVWVVNAGDGGILVSKKETISREGVYNVVVATGQRSDGTAAATAVAYDLDPRSATVYGGSFGTKPRFYVSALLTTAAQCQATAQAILERTKGASSSIALSAIVNPALEGGDVVQCSDGETSTVHIADSFPIPFSESATQDVTTRALDIPDEQ